jgi:hypothetical protein
LEDVYDLGTLQNQDNLRKIIQHERGVEFALEGLRLFDVRRWKIAEDFVKYLNTP